MNEMQNILKFLHLAEKLKCELRHSWLSSGRQESVAEHSWRISLMACIFYSHLEVKVDLKKSLKIAIIHDLAEAEAYDVPAFESHRQEEKKSVELKAMQNIKKLDSNFSDEIFDLWQEYEEQKTFEAKFIKALDKMEVRLQHNEADMETWNDVEYPRSQYVADRFCDFDKFLKEFNRLIKEESKDKIIKSGRNFQEVEKEVKELQ
ncbi:MAG: HD domain-containing protein [Patescibacteria group bacterium]|nr:HD domain-containing protein [Patescibacteria group bacterium]